MKKLAMLLLTFVLLLSTAAAASAAGLTVNISQSAETASAGDQITLTLSLSGAGSVRSGSVAVTVSDGLEVVSGMMLKDGAVINSFDMKTNKGVVALEKAANYDGEYARIVVKVKAGAAGTQTVKTEVKLKPGDATASATATISVAGTAPTAAESYVRRAYNLILNRTEIEPEGLAHWTNALNNGTSAGEIVKEFFRSEEFKSRGLSVEETVRICYKTMLDREPGRDEIANWAAMLNDGYSTTKLVAEFVSSAEFKDLCADYGLSAGAIAMDARDQNSNITRFVARCYDLALERAPDEDGLNEWCEHLLTQDLTPERVAFGFVFSDEAKDRGLSDEAFITMLYKLMLDREPDADGLENWVSALQQNTAAEIAYDQAFETGRSEADAIDQTRQNIYALFAASEEFGLMIKNFGF